MGVTRQIIGSLGDIGVEVLKETAKVPVEITGNVIKPQAGEKQPEKPHGTSNWPILDSKNTEPRHILQQFVGTSEPVKKPPTVWEQKQAEDKQKKEVREKQKDMEKKQSLPRTFQKQKTRTQKYGLGVKTNIEKQRDAKAE